MTEDMMGLAATLKQQALATSDIIASDMEVDFNSVEVSFMVP